MHLKSIFLIIAPAIFFYSCQSGSGSEQAASILGDQPQEFKGSINISGAFALYPLANVWAEEFSKIHPKVRFNISAGGAGKGMADALAQAVELGMFSREIREEEKQKGAWWIAVAKDAVLPVVSADNPGIDQLQKKGLSREALRRIFITGEIKDWGEAIGENPLGKISVYTRSDASGAAATWAEYLGGEGQEALQGIGVYGDPGLADALKKDKNGIGYNNVIYVYDLATKKKYPGVEVVPIDINGDGIISDDEQFYTSLDEIAAAIGDGRYPSPPARELYFVSKGQPQSKLVQAFLTWVLTDGQKFVEHTGYIKLPAAEVRSEAAKLTETHL